MLLRYGMTQTQWLWFMLIWSRHYTIQGSLYVWVIRYPLKYSGSITSFNSDYLTSLSILYLLLLLNRKVYPHPILISWEFSRHKYIQVRHNKDDTEKKAGFKYKHHYAHNTLFGAKFCFQLVICIVWCGVIQA